MKQSYLQIILLFNLLILSSLKAQVVTTASIHLLLLNEDKGKPLETTIQWHCLKTNKDVFYKTDKNGKTTVNIKGNETYELSILESLTIYTIEIPNFPNYEKDLILKFVLEKEDTKSNAILQAPLQNDIEITYQNLVGIQILNKPLGKSLEIIDMNNQRKVLASRDDSIKLVFPTKGRYKLAIEGVKIQNDTFIMESFSPKMIPFVLYFYSDKSAVLHHIYDKTVINLVQVNINDKPVVGDSITLIGKKSGLQYKLKTNENGSALFIVPKNDIYEIQLKYFPKVATIDVESSMYRDLTTFSYILNYPSSVEVDNRKKEEDISIAERDSLYKLFTKELLVRDISPLFKILKSEWESSLPKFSQNISLNKDSIKAKLEQDVHFFEKIQNIVCAVLYRFQKKWTNKVIVTDVTGSMSPYMHELALWHSLEFMKEEKNAYVFFNDGDNKPDYAKVVGNTGGIYITQSSIVDTIVNTMNKAMSNGGGGDSPENDIEALLVGQRYVQSSTELILIADSYSPIKDIRLLTKLNKPVRIILCGANTLTGFHPDYLWLAYKTRGSIHTIEEDIMNLSETVEGKIISIKGRSYKLLSNRFFEIK